MLSALQNPASPLSLVLQRSDVWVGGQLAPSCGALASRFPALDAELPGGGWPRGALIDLMLARPGIGEMALVLPALATLTARDEWVVVQVSAQALFAPAWQAAGVQLSRLIVLETPTGSPRLSASEHLWSCEQVLRAGSVSAFLFCLPRGVTPTQLRRLQVAAEAGGTLAFVLQDDSRRDQASPAPLRLWLEPGEGHLRVRVLKRRGASMEAPIGLAWGDFSLTPGEGSGSCIEEEGRVKAEVLRSDQTLSDVLFPAETGGSHAVAGAGFSKTAA